MKKFLTWFVVTLVLWVLMYFAFTENVPGALNVLKFWTWFGAFVINLTLLDKHIESQAKENAKPIQNFVGGVTWLCLCGLMIWFGHIFTGIAALWIVIINNTVTGEVDKKRQLLLSGNKE